MQKLHYLKGAVRGEAAALLKSVEAIGENYGKAWTLLRNRYENESQVIEAHLHALLTQSKVHTESSNELRRLIDTTAMHVQSLETLGVAISFCSPFLVYLIVDKLDQETVETLDQTNNIHPTTN